MRTTHVFTGCSLGRAPYRPRQAGATTCRRLPARIPTPAPSAVPTRPCRYPETCPRRPATSPVIGDARPGDAIARPPRMPRRPAAGVACVVLPVDAGTGRRR